MEAIRKELKSRRKSLGLSAEKLAEMAITTKSQVLNFENGKANITIHLLEKLCNALNVTIQLQSK